MLKPNESWNEATPQDIPPPTYWPAVLALGLTLIFWGFVTIYIMSIAGCIIFALALGGWINELRKDVNSNHKNSSHGS